MKPVGRYATEDGVRTLTIDDNPDGGYRISYAYTEEQDPPTCYNTHIVYEGTSSAEDPFQFHFTQHDTYLSGPWSGGHSSHDCDISVQAQEGENVDGVRKITLPRIESSRRLPWFPGSPEQESSLTFVEEKTES